MTMELWEKVREVPENAKKQIGAGRLKGMTDINPMWRIKTLTENFGPCGVGWYTEVERQWLENGAEGVICAFCNIRLYVKQDGEWSKPIFGTGGSALVAKESKGLYTSDEAYKMAYTDALSVACKALGIGADVYWKDGRTKYQVQEVSNKITKEQASKLMQLISETNTDLEKLLETYKVKKLEDMTPEQCENCRGILLRRLNHK